MDFPLPPVGEGLFEVELVRWLVAPGQRVSRGQSLMEVMSDKATMEVPAPFEGRITATVPPAGAKIKVGEVVLRYDGGGGAVEDVVAVAPPVAATGGNSAVAVRTGGTGTLVSAAPSVRRLARMLNLSLDSVRGSGPGGRVLLDDLAPYLNKPAAAGPKPVSVPAPDYGKPGTRVPMAGLRRKVAEKMVASKQAIPHYSYVDECDFTNLVSLRNQLKDPLAAQGVKLTYLAFVIKAVAKALKDVPIVNSTYDEAGGNIILHDSYHVGVAVAVANGLVVPVVRDADKKDIAGIAAAVERLSVAARAGKLTTQDLQGGTFTVTSVGNVGGLISTPIINHPEVGILGVGKVVKRPVYDAAGAIVPAEIGYLSFSFDHRVVDGAVGAVFANSVIKRLQSPAALLLAGA